MEMLAPEADDVQRLLSANDAAQLVFVIELIASQQWSQFVLTLRNTLRHSSAAVQIASLQALRQLSAVRMLPYIELLLEEIRMLQQLQPSASRLGVVVVSFFSVVNKRWSIDHTDCEAWLGNQCECFSVQKNGIYFTPECGQLIVIAAET